ncbi:LPS translocon maturation chaperone LptM [Acidovorax sp.]|jgi:predicted small lipoprotein YifL|uniref:LPS translocon maturation chaperone LptM n=1 Tax=Acidovorax sp. TaxID=1872122 RepID=UPI00391FBD31
MLKACEILVRAIVLMATLGALYGCGQRGPLYLPSPTQAPQRASLPQTLVSPVTDVLAPRSEEPQARSDQPQ